MSPVAFAWLSSITYGLGGVLGKISSKQHITNPWLFSFVWSLLSVLFILPFALMSGVSWPTDWGSMMHLGVASAVSAATFALAFYAVDLSIMSPLSNVRTLVAALVGVLFLGEILSTMQWIYVVLLVFATVCIHLDERFSLRAFFTKGTLLAAFWILTSVWFNSMINIASATNGFWEVSLWSNILMTVFLLPTLPLFVKDMRKTPFTQYKGLALTTVLWTAGFIFSVSALADNLGISLAIISLPLSMVFVMLLSFVKPNLIEHHTPRVYAIRFVSAIVMLIAALGLSS
jgi:drug/metabolite transporter (DMT)-like permease